MAEYPFALNVDSPFLMRTIYNRRMQQEVPACRDMVT